LPLCAALLLAALPLAAQNPSPVSPLPAASVVRETRLALLQDQVRPGEPLTVALAGPLPPETTIRAVLTAEGRRLGAAAFFPLPETADGKPPCRAALLGIPSTLRAGPALIRVEAGQILLGELALDIAARSFATEEIPLNQANTDILTQEDPQKTREAEQLWALLNRAGGDFYSGGPFIPPLSSTRRTSFFGDRRVFVYTDGSRDRSIHGGVDYGVPIGTPVWACADGKVVLARSRIVTGNSVVVEHLPGVYSLYYHLDSMAVSEGQILKAGDSIGKSGVTGLATGPHLHWEIRVAGENTDPDALTARPVIDREAILSKLGL
jgi:murein DD-endopeptidase MepM/ murein hydrolase activator NlpD